MRTNEKDRRDWIIVLIIILIGLLLILLAGGCALRLTPQWSLDSDMGSNLNPDSAFLTDRPNTLFEPIDISILTKPAWANDGLYLTPGASIRTGTPFPTAANTLPPQPTRTTTVPLTVTPTLATVVVPTRTSEIIPAPTKTFTPLPGPLPSANLSISVSDGATTYDVGGTITYTITVDNPAGSATVNGATVNDTFPAALSSITWTCISSGGATCTASGSGNINSTANLPAGSSVTYTVNANISSATTGNLANMASVTVPAGITDPSTANNSATDTDTPVFKVDLQITKTDGVTVYTPGSKVTYTIVVRNLGPADATGATVADTFTIPALAGSTTWTCIATTGASCSATGSGSISDTVKIPKNGRLTYTANAATSASASVDLVNTASVTAPTGYTETATGDNSSTDTDTVFIPDVSISITKTDGATTYTPGKTLTYTITASNAGPDDASGITVADTFDATRLTNITWTCAAGGSASCAASGSGNISDTVSLPASSTVTYTISAKAKSSATGDLSNTASVGIPTNVNDSNASDNTATDVDTPNYVADLQITNTDNASEYTAGVSRTYTITVLNAGPSDVSSATVTTTLAANADIVPASLTWTCSGSGTTCTASGTGDINGSISLPTGSSVTYVLSAQVVGSPSGATIDNTASVSAVTPAGVTDDPTNNSVNDSDTLIVSSGTTYGNLGTTNDGNIQSLSAPSTLIMTLSSPIVVNGSHSGPDLIYYEAGLGGNTYIAMDWIKLWVSNGSNWYLIFDWGNNTSNAGTTLSVPLPVPPNATTCSGEPDNCNVVAALLTNNTGIAVDMDAPGLSLPTGTYPYIKIEVPAGGADGGVGIDGIYVVP